MATSIPRGIQAVVWKNKDKSTSVRYRVRIKRKDYKEDRLFDTLEEAKEFLQLSKSKRKPFTQRASGYDDPKKGNSGQIFNFSIYFNY